VGGVLQKGRRADPSAASFWEIETMATYVYRQREGAGHELLRWGCLMADGQGMVIRVALDYHSPCKKFFYAAGFRELFPPRNFDGQKVQIYGRGPA